MLKGVEFGSLGSNTIANRYSQLVEFVSAVTEDGDMPIITLFSEAIHPNNLVIMITCMRMPPAVCIHAYILYIYIFYSSEYF